MNVNFSHTAFRSPAIKLLAAIVIAFSGSRLSLSDLSLATDTALL